MPRDDEEMYIVDLESGASVKCTFDTFLTPDPRTGKLTVRSDEIGGAIQVKLNGEKSSILDNLSGKVFVFSDVPEKTMEKGAVNDIYSARLRAIGDNYSATFFMQETDEVIDLRVMLQKLTTRVCANIKYVLLEVSGSSFVTIQSIKGEKYFSVYSNSSYFKQRPGVDLQVVDFRRLLELACENGAGFYYNIDENDRASAITTPKQAAFILHNIFGV